MITLNQLISLYQDIGSRHKQVNDFMAVQDFNIEMDRAPTYPLLVVNPVSANMPKSEGGYTVFNTTLELQVIDLVNKDNNNRMDVMSDTQQIIADIVTEFSTHPYYMENSIDTVSDISFDPIRGAYGGDVDGWKISITLEHPVKLSYCSAPVENIQGFDFSAPDAVAKNTTGSFEVSIPLGGTKVLDDEQIQLIDVNNNILSNYSNPLYENIQIHVPVIGTTPPSGIQYQRNYRSGQTTSYALYDDGWQTANGGYDYTILSNPLYTQQLDYTTDNTGKTLLYNNEFGNKLRFTDINGNATTSTTLNKYVIDNLTGIGWADSNDAASNGNFDSMFGASGYLATVQNTGISYLGTSNYTDWMIANTTMLYTIVQQEISPRFMLPKLSAITNSRGTSTTLSSGTTAYLRFSPTSGTQWTSVLKSQSNVQHLFCRIHF